MLTFSTTHPSSTTPHLHPTPLLLHHNHLSFTTQPPHQCHRHRLIVKSTTTPQPNNQETHLTNTPQPNNQETHLTNTNHFFKQTKLKIAVIGFGNFGQFLSKAFVRQGHTVYTYSRSNYQSIAQQLGVSFFTDPHDLCEQHPDVVMFCTSIISMPNVLKSLPIQRLKRNTLFVDVLSVKEFPKNVFLQHLPTHFDVLCTHPMFGPESGKISWRDLPFVFDKVRIGNEASRVNRVDSFLDVFSNEGCRMVEMTCAEHDKYAAGSQFITHTMGRVLEKLELESTPINTKGYETLLNLVENTGSDSFDLYYGLFMYNKNAMEELERLDLAFESLKKELFGHLHEVLRKQVFGKSEEGGVRMPVLHKLPKNSVPHSLLPPGAPWSENVMNN